MIAEEIFVQIHIGNVVTYKMKPCDRPIHPDRLWKGKVKAVLPGKLYIEVLDEGYEQEKEVIGRDQVIQLL